MEINIADDEGTVKGGSDWLRSTLERVINKRNICQQMVQEDDGYVVMVTLVSVS
jgi:hypothetical protein